MDDCRIGRDECRVPARRFGIGLLLVSLLFQPIAVSAQLAEQRLRFERGLQFVSEPEDVMERARQGEYLPLPPQVRAPGSMSDYLAAIEELSEANMAVISFAVITNKQDISDATRVAELIQQMLVGENNDGLASTTGAYLGGAIPVTLDSVNQEVLGVGDVYIKINDHPPLKVAETGDFPSTDDEIEASLTKALNDGLHFFSSDEYLEVLNEEIREIKDIRNRLR